jgi:hypothetical protein
MKRKWLAIVLAILLAVPATGCIVVRVPHSATYSASPTQSAVLHSASATPQGTSRKEALDAFREIAFTSEYGGTTDEIRKWTKPIRAEVLGAPTDEDRAALARAMGGLNAVQGFPGIDLAQDGITMEIWFVPLEDMAEHLPEYVPGNWGFFSTNWNNSGITHATIAIATDVTDQMARNHLIFEEVLQSTGLMQDSLRYPDSIFYGEWTTVQAPSALDWELLGMLYMPQLEQGMPSIEAMRILEEQWR